MRNLRPILALLGALVLPVHGQDQKPDSLSLSPLANQDSGALPSGHDRIVFRMWNGNWSDSLALPARPVHGQSVEISNQAVMESVLGAATTELRIDRLRLPSGQSYGFTYDGDLRTWRVADAWIARVAPQRVAAASFGRSRISFIDLADGDWVPSVDLPQGDEGAIVVIRSRATWPSRIGGEVLFASTFRLRAGDSYTFEYSQAHGKWLPRATPEHAMPLQARLMPPSGPRSRLLLANGYWLPRITLPSQAGDRDRLVIESTATWPATLVDPLGQMAGPLALHSGDRYEFMYVAEEARWVLMAHPTRIYQVRGLASGRLPALTAPRTRVFLANGNHVPVLRLPQAPVGSEVVVDSAAEWPVLVDTGDGDGYTVDKGAEVAFSVDASGHWQRGTRTIDLLMVYSNPLASGLGDAAVRAYLFEAMKHTNEALENSGANFRFRMREARALPPKPSWTVLGDALTELRNDVLVQGWRDQFKADGIYYLGTEKGCGLAFVRASEANMVASESYGCGPLAMRHELGHAVALHHAHDTMYGQGYPLAGTIMAGNHVPLYSTPMRFTQDLGIRAGVVDRYDAVRALNERSAEVAAFR